MGKLTVWLVIAVVAGLLLARRRLDRLLLS